MSTNGNGNGKQVMVSQQPQLQEVGLTQVRPGEGNVETLLISTNEWGLNFTRPTAHPNSKSFAVSADQLILDALKQALNLKGNPQFRALVSLRIQVEVIDHKVDVPGVVIVETNETINGRSQEFALVDPSTQTACDFIGISTDEAPTEADPVLDTEVRKDDRLF